MIVVESTIGSSANTGILLQYFVGWLLPSQNAALLEVIHHLLRKVGHFIGYGILGYLCFRALKLTFPDRQQLVNIVLAVVLSFGVASLDEWNQSFSAARTGQFVDVILDTFGALSLVLLGAAVCFRNTNGASHRRHLK